VLPETRYTNVGEAQVAYQVFGEGPDLLWAQGLSSHIDFRWDEPRQARFLHRLGAFARVIMFDRRGIGASDPLPAGEASSWEDWVDDLNAVLQAAGSERPSIMASIDAGPMAMVFAATYPERVASLILIGTVARSMSAPGYPGIGDEAAQVVVDAVRRGWGKDDGLLARVFAPDQADDPEFRRWMARQQRASMTPRRAEEMVRIALQQDAREVLPLIQAPTLVAAPERYPVLSVEAVRYLADNIPDSRLVMLDASTTQTFLLDPDRLLAEIEKHVTGEQRPVEPDRVLATVLFTDIVGSTERASEVGDRKWRDLLDEHDQLSRNEIERNGGKLVKTTGDGVMATFDGPARAVRCAAELSRRLAETGMQIRAGLHAGEVEMRGDDIGGIAVHIAARVMAKAQPGEVLVSSTVKGLVAGSGLVFEDRGTHELKGIPEEWPLHALALASAGA
jgi:class 3 adenylate cyclase